MIWLAAVALLLLGLGWQAWRRSATLRQESGLPQGRLIYADTHDENWQPALQPLYSAAHRLVGKPDYLVETGRGTIPIEVKSSRSPAPDIPYLGHILQVAAYCLLVEETHGQTPPHGWLKYADAMYEIDFTRELRQELLATMAEMREAHAADDLSRSHDLPGKCAACAFNAVCDEALSN